MRRAVQQAIVAAIVGVVVGAVLVITSIPSGEIRVTRVNWSASTDGGSATGPPGGCLAGMPASTPGVVTSPSHWFTASVTLSVNPTYNGSCSLWEVQVHPAGFVYLQGRPGWGQVTTGTELSLNLTTPPTPFGPAPIDVTLYTSTTPGCYCP